MKRRPMLSSPSVSICCVLISALRFLVRLVSSFQVFRSITETSACTLRLKLIGPFGDAPVETT